MSEEILAQAELYAMDKVRDTQVGLQSLTESERREVRRIVAIAWLEGQKTGIEWTRDVVS